jgi:exopolysaccharide biosynthesis polyprenyl glycosylphosphotransferase
MAMARKRESGPLLIGDIAVFAVSLWITLALRNLAVPSTPDFLAHLAPFSFLFMVWIVVFFIGGLYDRNTLVIKSSLPKRVLSAHIFNLVIAIIFFYAIPYFGIAPKVILFLYLLVSTVLLGVWRLALYPRFAKSAATNIIILAEGKEVDELVSLLSSSKNSVLRVTKAIKPSEGDAEAVGESLKRAMEEGDAHVIAVDLGNPAVQKVMNNLYQFIFSGVQFIQVQDLYEDVTDRVPLGLIDETWFLKHASIEPNFVYDTLKRVMDVVISLPLGILTLAFYPFVWLAIKIEDKGPLFIYQSRVGQNDKLVNIAKFRSMTVSDEGKWVEKNDVRVTKVGKFIRKSRIDEVPQLWNILWGDISLIGPRPELPPLVNLYKKEIPHYNVRHLIKPGISGWAQIHHEKPPHSIEETFEKLSYDLYYIKHRSFWLDLRIALQTVKTLLSRVGV